MKNRVPLQQGLTLVELLLASALATVLMVGVLAVVTNLTMTEKALNPLRGESGKNKAMTLEELDAWASLLREDLNHAGRIEALASGEVQLTGYQAMVGSAREVTHRVATVRYQMQEVDGRRWVVRRQTMRDGLAGAQTTRDLVGAGVRRFELVPTGYRQIGTGLVSGAANATLSSETTSATTTSQMGAAGVTRIGGVVVDLSEYQRAWHRWEGQWLCIENAPPWIKAMRPDALGRPSMETTEQELKGVQADEQGEGTDLIREIVPGGFVWRLRVWMDDAVMPTHERILTIQ